MASFKVGEAVGLSPVINFNLTDSLMKGAQFGMHEQAAEAKALAARMKKEKIMSLDMSNIHPTLRKEAEDVAYNTVAAQKIAADSGESPMVPFTIGQFQLKQMQSKSKRRFDLEKSDPNKYLMDPDAMTLFANGDASGARKLLEKKGYDPELINSIDPNAVSFLPEKVNINKMMDDYYGYTKNAADYVPSGKPTDIGNGHFKQIMVLNPNAAEQAANGMAMNSNVRLNIMYERPEEYQKAFATELLKSPGDPNLAKVRAVASIIKNPNNPYLPSAPENVTPTKSPTINVNVGGDNNYQPGFLQEGDVNIQHQESYGSWSGKKEYSVPTEFFPLNPQEVGIPTATLKSVDGTTPSKQIGAKDVKSALATSLPINTSGETIKIRTATTVDGQAGKTLTVEIKPGQVVDPSLITKGFLNDHKGKIKYVPAALYTEEKDVNGVKVKKSYYTRISRGSTNLYPDNDVKNKQFSQTLSSLQGFSDKKNKEFGLGGNPGQASKKKETPAERAARIANGG